MICTISREWTNICKVRRFFEGLPIKLGASDNNVIHVRIVPQFGLLTRLVTLIGNGVFKPFFRPEQYFFLGEAMRFLWHFETGIRDILRRDTICFGYMLWEVCLVMS